MCEDIVHIVLSILVGNDDFFSRESNSGGEPLETYSVFAAKPIFINPGMYGRVCVCDRRGSWAKDTPLYHRPWVGTCLLSSILDSVFYIYSVRTSTESVFGRAALLFFFFFFFERVHWNGMERFSKVGFEDGAILQQR